MLRPRESRLCARILSGEPCGLCRSCKCAISRRFGRGDVDERVPAIYQEMERLFGVISPPVALHSPAPDMLAATWMIMSEALLVNGLVERNVKEAVATAVSVGNECPYCVTVHGTMMRSLGHGGDATALAHDRIADIADPDVRAVAGWVRANASSVAAVGDDAKPPFAPEQTPEILGVALVFHYFNRMVNVFLPDAPMPPLAPNALVPVVLPVLGRFLRSAYRNRAPVGGTLRLLPEAPLPPTSPGRPTTPPSPTRCPGPPPRTSRRRARGPEHGPRPRPSGTGRLGRPAQGHEPRLGGAGHRRTAGRRPTGRAAGAADRDGLVPGGPRGGRRFPGHGAGRRDAGGVGFVGELHGLGAGGGMDGGSRGGGLPGGHRRPTAVYAAGWSATQGPHTPASAERASGRTGSRRGQAVSKKYCRFRRPYDPRKSTYRTHIKPLIRITGS